MAHERLRPEFFFDRDKIEKLKQIAPECFEDGKINFETLRQNLGDWRQDEEDPELEHFGLFWPGKRDARRAAAIPPEGTLEPVWGEGLKADGSPDTDEVNDSKNIFIEGENLEVLKILQKSYAGKIKMIYIDPPYNTGNDFVYDDDFTEPLQEYLRRTGQVDEEGKPMTTNKRSDGRFHSKWLSMMYPRLRLARNLLREDGVIFVSIDDNEVNNLKAIMNEIFGEENFLGCVTVVSNWKGRSDDNYFATAHNYLLAWGRDDYKSKGIPLPSEYNSDYPELDSQGRAFRLQGLRKRGTSARRVDRPKMFYPLYINPTNGNVSTIQTEAFSVIAIPKLSDGTDGRWRWGMDTVIKRINELTGRPVGKESRWDVFQIDYSQNEDGLKRIKPKTVWTGSEFSNESGGLEFKSLMGHKAFDNPKPLALINIIMQLSLDDEDIVLDFFAGSGTTGQALYEYNLVEQFNCSFILVQIPEIITEEKEAFSLGYKSITQITTERLRKSLQKKKIRDGYKYFKLTNSNFNTWQNFDSGTLNSLEDALDLFNQSPLKKNWNKCKLLSEIILNEGFPLDCSSEEIKIANNNIYSISAEGIEHTLKVCLDKKIDDEEIQKLSLGSLTTFICLDSSISSLSKLRLSDKGLIKTI